MSKVRLASSILLTRGSSKDMEIFLVKRSPQLRFMGDFWAFPGGTVIAEDQLSCNDPEEKTLVHCASRELFEETGILPGSCSYELDDVDRSRIRQELLDETSLRDWLRLLGQECPTNFLTPICMITTPPFSPVRYRTCFMHVNLPDASEPEIKTGELVEGKFFKPADAVGIWKRGEINIAPPNLFLLRLLAKHELSSFKKEAAVQAKKFAAGGLHSVFFSPGIFMAPQRTPTLPPATTTNTLIVGTDRLYVVEPATPEQEEQRHLFDKIDELIAEGKKFEAILLTHHHIDHTGAVNAVSQRYKLPVHAHPLTYGHLEEGYIKGQPLQDGDRIELGNAPDGSPDWHLKVIHTPGHAPDHICYLDSRYHALIAGDMLSTVSTILIDPPEGHMRTYLESLERLLEYPLKTLFPSHGGVHLDGAALIRKYLQHRKEREQVIIDTLATGTNAQTIENLVPVVYADVDKSIHGIASRSLLAGLIKLEEDGLCQLDKDGWRLIN